jgi:hypothetical protein
MNEAVAAASLGRRGPGIWSATQGNYPHERH